MIDIKKKCCIIIPIYNENPTESEIKSIKRNITVLDYNVSGDENGYDIFAMCPESLDVSAYKDLGICNFLTFHDKFFRSNKSYSRLILSEKFYEPFLEYEYMLIAQTDTYILNESYSLGQFLDKGYDYWGAPWPNGPFDEPYGLREWFKSIFVPKPQELHVGNGGFSLRKVATTYELVKRNRFYIKYLWRLNEDLFFSKNARNGAGQYVAAPVLETSRFALETNMQEEIEKGNVPFAVHAWEKHLSKDMIDKLIK